MSKVDPTQFTKLDRRSTILFQAARKQTEAVEEKFPSGVEEPGIDTLRGSFGTVGSIIRARSARRMSQSSGVSVPSSRFGVPSSRLDIERGNSKTASSSAAPNFNHYGGMKRHQLFDPPVSPLDASEPDAISLTSQPSVRKPAIKFGEQDLIHSYHRGTTGKDDMATHERRVVPHGSSPLASPSSSVQPSLPPPDSLLRQQQPPGATNSVSPLRFDAGASMPRSAPPGVGAAVGVYRDPFEGAPATATLPSFSSATSLVDDGEPRPQHHRSFSRQGSSRDYPKGDRTDDAEERLFLWDPHGDNTSDTDIAGSPGSPDGTIRLVGPSRSGRF